MMMSMFLWLCCFCVKLLKLKTNFNQSKNKIENGEKRGWGL